MWCFEIEFFCCFLKIIKGGCDVGFVIFILILNLLQFVFGYEFISGYFGG